MDRIYIVRELNRLLANYFVLSMKLFRYNHFVKGEHIHAQMTFFQDCRNQCAEDIEDLATFIASIDGRPFATMIKCIKESTLKEASADDEEAEIIGTLQHDLTNIIHQIEHICEERDESVNHFLYPLQRNLQEARHICKRMQT